MEILENILNKGKNIFSKINNILNKIRNIVSKTKNILYPDKCILCREILTNKNDKCVCDKCGKYIIYEEFNIVSMPETIYEYIEEKDKSFETGIERAFGVFKYQGIVRDSIRRWKYKGIRKYARGYADLIANELALPVIFDIDGFIPVPISYSRGKKRGFNQAYDLSKELTKLTGIATYDCLKRIKETKAQSKCSGKERMNNILNSIKKYENYNLPTLKNVAIIDDIYTTGSTARECIRALTKEYSMRDTKFYIIVVGIGE